MSLKNILFVVDGPTENGALRKRLEMDYFESPEIRLGPGNGKEYSIKGYVKGVYPLLIYSLSSNFRAIILIPDLEKRKINFEQFAIQLKAECISEISKKTNFKKEDLINKIFVCPPNIMFENWIISDIQSISEKFSEFDKIIPQEPFDGVNGSSIIQKFMNCKYKKTVHGSKFFKKINFEYSCRNSPSFDIFWNLFNDLFKKHCL